MNKKTVKVTFVCLMCVLLLTACGSSGSPEKTVGKFFGAVKSGDVDKAIECFMPTIQEQYKAGIAIADGLFGIDSRALLSAVLGTANIDAYRNYDFKVSGSTKTDGDHATVSVDVYIDGSINSTTSVRCIEIDGKWYIEQ